MENDDIDETIDIDEILYNGTEKQVKEIVSKYKISFAYNNDIRSFSWKSKVLNIVTRGYKSHYEPNCVKYLGNVYEQN